MMTMLEGLRPGVFPELVELENLINEYAQFVRLTTVDQVEYKGKRFPLYCLEIGSTSPEAPVFGLFGGVHGLERIGTQVILVFLRSFLNALTWDKTVQERLEKIRLVLMPIVNPVGMFHFRRSNGNHVDLMRNSPIEAVGPSINLGSGHRLSPYLPCYRGQPGKMEAEAQALVEVVRQKLLPAPISIALDVHSGFGVKDRIWFPWANSMQPFPLLHQVVAYKEILDKSYPYHVYQIEPSALHYVIHGDLWDYLFVEYLKKEGVRDGSPRNRSFLPFTLELGSWLWLKKNPLQAFNRLAFWHPLKTHRVRRIFRRHLHLFDFIQRSLISSDVWLLESENRREEYRQRGLEAWYGGSGE